MIEFIQKICLSSDEALEHFMVETVIIVLDELFDEDGQDSAQKLFSGSLSAVIQNQTVGQIDCVKFSSALQMVIHDFRQQTTLRVWDVDVA